MQKLAPKNSVTALGLLVGSLWCSAGHAQDNVGKACVTFAEGTTVETSDVYFSALKIETRKVGGNWVWHLAEACEEQLPALMVSGADQATLTLKDTDPQTYRLNEPEVDARARTLARSVMTDLIRVGSNVMAPPLLDPLAEIALGGMVRTPIQVEPQKDIQWLLRLGGNYQYQMPNNDEKEELMLSHMMGPQLEVGAAFFNERLVVSLAGSYRMGQTSSSEEVSYPEREDWAEDDLGDKELLSNECDRGDREACDELRAIDERFAQEFSYTEKAVLDFRTGEVIAMARTGKTWGILKLVGGLGLGWRHEEVVFNWSEEALSPSDSDFEPESTTQNFSGDSGVLAADAALIWQFTKVFHAGLFVGGRTYFAQTGSLYGNADFFKPSPINLGGQFVLGVDL